MLIGLLLRELWFFECGGKNKKGERKHWICDKHMWKNAASNMWNAWGQIRTVAWFELSARLMKLCVSLKDVARCYWSHGTQTWNPCKTMARQDLHTIWKRNLTFIIIFIMFILIKNETPQKCMKIIWIDSSFIIHH